MSGTWLIYGATGYTGKLIADEAKARGLRPLLGGRSEEKLAAMAQHLGLEYRVAPLDDSGRLDAVLRDVDVVLHAAGPFRRTAQPMVDACLRTRSHYLDITGEAPVIESLQRRDAEARRHGVMLMPGVGFDVVPSDCLAAHVADRLPGATHLYLGIGRLTLLTRGSAKSFLQYAGEPIRVRRGGVIQRVPSGSLERWFDYGEGARPSSAVSWGDVSSAYYTTGIPNIETYFESYSQLRAALLASRLFGWFLRTGSWQAWLHAQADLRPEGPTPEQRAAMHTVIVAEAFDAAGRRVVSRLRTPEAYTFTGQCAAAIAERAAAGDIELGFQTPARVYGRDFVLAFPGVSREDLAA